MNVVVSDDIPDLLFETPSFLDFEEAIEAGSTNVRVGRWEGALEM
jgi:hypothetical protein